MKKLKKYFTLSVLVGFLGFWIYILISRGVRNYLLENMSTRTKAVIIDEKKYMGNSPVAHEFSYFYVFQALGKTFKGAVGKPGLQRGDTILIKYYTMWLSINTPIEE